jgi:hypothetical protein
MIAFRQVKELRDSRFGKFVRKITGAADDLTGGVAGGITNLAAGAVEEGATGAKEGAEYLADTGDDGTSTGDDGTSTDEPNLPTGAEFGIAGDDNMVEIEDASTHEECMAKATAANYSAFAMKKDGDEYNKCFGYSTTFNYPLTKEIDTSYTACADPAMKVADMCVAKMDEETTPEEEEKMDIQYENMKGYILHGGKSVVNASDTILNTYEDETEQLDYLQCGEMCDQEDKYCTGIIYDANGRCRTLTNETAFPAAASELEDNPGGALYQKMMAPGGYEIPSTGMDHTGAPIGRFTGLTVAQCAAECDKKEGCVGLSMFNSGTCMLKDKSALETQMIERKTGSTFIKKIPKTKKKKVDLMKPMPTSAAGPTAASESLVVSQEVVNSTTETFVPEWLYAKKNVRGMNA